jgi:Plavaka transposase
MWATSESGNGTCRWCLMSFKNLRMHINKKHPDVVDGLDGLQPDQPQQDGTPTGMWLDVASGNDGLVFGTCSPTRSESPQDTDWDNEPKAQETNMITRSRSKLQDGSAPMGCDEFLERQAKVDKLEAITMDEEEDFWESANEDIPIAGDINGVEDHVQMDMNVQFAPTAAEWLPFTTQLEQFYVSSTDLTMAGLYRTCEAAGAPLYLMDQLMDKIRHALATNALTEQLITRRASLIGRTQRKLKMPVAEKVPVQLELGDIVYVYRYNFMEIYQDHLHGEAFSKIEHLVLADKSDIWCCMPIHEPDFSEINNSNWFHRTARTYEAELRSEQFILDPLMLYIDKTGTDRMQRHSLEPLMFTSTLLTKEARENSMNWKPLGLVPNLSSTSSAKRKGNKGRRATKSLSTRDYHRCLSVLLAPLVKCQTERPIMTFRRGDFVKKARVICPIAVVVGDNLSNSNLCGKVMNYKESSMRMGRRCLTSFGDTEKTPHSCIRINKVSVQMLQMASLGCTYGEEAIDDGEARTVPLSKNYQRWQNFLSKLNSKEKKIAERLRRLRERLATDVLRQILGSHSFLSKFDELEFGENPGGIHRATGADILHTVEEGLIPNLLEVFYGLMPPNTRGKIDDLVEQLFSKGRNRSSERDSFPKVSFARGYTSLTMLSANERVGQLFVLAILLQVPEGRKILNPRFAEDFDEKRKSREKCHRGSAEAVETEVEDNESVGSSIDEDEEENIDEDEEDNSVTGEGATAATTATSDSVREVREILTAIDLRFIITDVLPHLPKGHERALKKLVTDTVMASNTSAKDAREKAGKKPFIFEKGILDYDTRTGRGQRYERSYFTDVGREILPAVAPDVQEESDGETDRTVKLDMSQFTQLVEMILTMHACLKYGAADMGQGNNLKVFGEALERVRRTVREGVIRDESSNGYNTEKFLEMAHFLADFPEYGVPSGYSTETGERGLKDWAKKPARRTQKGTDEIFSGQTCARIQETAILQRLQCIEEARSGRGDRVEEVLGQDNAIDGGSLYDKMFVFQVVRDGTSQTSPEIWRLLPSGQREKRNRKEEAYPREIKEWFFREYRKGKKGNYGPHLLRIEEGRYAVQGSPQLPG